MLVYMRVGQAGVSLHVWMAPLIRCCHGVKQTLRLDAICEPAPWVCVLDLLEPGSYEKTSY